MRIITGTLEPSIEGDLISFVRKLSLVNNIWSVKDHQIPGGILPTGKGKPGGSIDNKMGLMMPLTFSVLRKDPSSAKKALYIRWQQKTAL